MKILIILMLLLLYPFLMFQDIGSYILDQESGNMTLNNQPLCRWKLGQHSSDDFNLNSCSWCYFFLFPRKGLLPFETKYLQVMLNGSVFPKGTILLADINNITARSQVCSTLSESECAMWKMCCESARECCRRQIAEISPDAVGDTCQSTWDGYACWEGGTPGTKSYKSCPTFLKFSVPTSK